MEPTFTQRHCGHLVVHDGVDKHRHRVLGQDLKNVTLNKGEVNEECLDQISRDSCYLLWRNIKSLCPHVNLLVNVHTGNDEEHAGAPGSSCQYCPMR